MARKLFNFKIPGIGKKITQNDIVWGVIGAVGVGALYFILKNQDTGIPFVDSILEPIGDITGLEGQGATFLPQIFGNAPMPLPTPTTGGAGGDEGGGSVAMVPSFSDWRFANAYAADYGDIENDMRFSGTFG
jgi:hypothetical protein